MSIRFKALEFVQGRKPITVTPPSKKVSDYFGTHVFSSETMKEVVSPDAFKKLTQAIKKGERIEPSVADAVATAMKNWAIERGATHYTHWFQPLTGLTAEKHDAFFELKPDGTTIEQFKGNALVQQEPDASSFPNGGLRNTFEARGYTAWDPTSPAFLIESGNNKTLCIPTVFVAYTGEALDNKAPLLKAMDRLDKAATSVAQYFDRNVTKVNSSLGCEQEFFLIDKALHDARPDLVASGRTVFGSTPPRGQQMDDHYFGSIPSRVQRFLQELEIECYKVGIPIKTRHNEVAPSQFEVAPIFEEVNVAVDHNSLLMDLMNKVGERHDFAVLFHEKPFQGLNGSGKHNNWSLVTDTGKNLLQPSTKARTNLQFLTFFVNIIKSVHEHADLIRASIASAGNDFRLGANEAPPAIISVFIGSQLTAVLDELEKNGDIKIDKGDNVFMKLGIDKIPPILLDNTDRNRTSPFAFTGNKFEFRAVGSSTNTALPMTVLATALADQLEKFRQEVGDQLDGEGKKEVAIINVLRKYIKESNEIRFEGNGYGDEWVEEAKKRGLSNIPDTPSALDAYLSEKSLALFKRQDIMTKPEIEARHEILLENYIMKVQIESRVMADLALNTIIPASIKYQNSLITNVKGLRDIGLDSETEEIVAKIKKISAYIRNLKTLSTQMIEARKVANAKEDIKEKALNYCHDVKGVFFADIRYNADKLEQFVDDADWPLPKYRELLFLR
ncbi:MAG: glutamine synthetase [Flammeovirgaceae bacterium]|jgi:glutamine synthetase